MQESLSLDADETRDYLLEAFALQDVVEDADFTEILGKQVAALQQYIQLQILAGLFWFVQPFQGGPFFIVSQPPYSFSCCRWRHPRHSSMEPSGVQGRMGQSQLSR